MKKKNIPGRGLTKVDKHWRKGRLASRQLHRPALLKINTNMSVNNTTLYFVYNKISICQGDMFRPLLGHLQAL